MFEEAEQYSNDDVIILFSLQRLHPKKNYIRMICRDMIIINDHVSHISIYFVHLDRMAFRYLLAFF